MGGPLEAVLVLLAISIILIALLSRGRGRARVPLPPGPPGIPLVGNVFDIPHEQAWVAYWDLSKRYGDVVSLSVLGQTTIVLNSMTAASDLLGKRTSIYASRPEPVVSISQMIGWDWSLVFMPYGNHWRRVRRVFWQHFHPNVVEQWQASQTIESWRFLRCLLEDHVGIEYVVKLSLLSVACGLPAEEVGSSCVKLLNEVGMDVSEALSPAVLALPWLRRLPAWFPGGYWLGKLPYRQALALKAFEFPLEAARNVMNRDDAKSTILGILSEAQDEDEQETTTALTKAITSTTFLAGTDTTAATLLGFVCAALLYPEVPKRAQEELDAVVGSDRLPQFADRASLPYVSAVVKEAFRWHNVAPLGVAHSCSAEDQYRGWRIPKEATIMANVWGILHDPDNYPSPETFNPDRFLKDGKLNEGVLDPASVVFGFGRRHVSLVCYTGDVADADWRRWLPRICPGRYFADNSLFIHIASLLHTFDIMPAVDEYGAAIPVKYSVISGLASIIEPFKCSFRPRSTAAEALVRDGTDVK
ncbi:cytochrome P450 [Cubamyces lactineus]|nr:cytochrome P450 [Cubamyces lactineus]